MDQQIYLASKSPRREELLKLTGLEFSVKPPGDLNEELMLENYKGAIEFAAEHIAREKASHALGTGIPGIYITADTMVIADDGTVLGKPSSDAEASMFLDRLSGNWHTVATGVALAECHLKESPASEILSVLVRTRVKFAEMTSQDVSEYIATGEPFDKAGGYGIQGRASIYVEKIDGCYFNVVGFPLNAFWNLWKEFNSMA